MKTEKSLCPKCGAFEVVFVGRSANPFNTKPPRLVCQKCGQEYEPDSGIRVLNRNTIQTFPCPERDLDDPFTAEMKERIESMRKTE